METPNQSNEAPKVGERVFVESSADVLGIARPGEPLARPYVVITMPYAKWLILKSSAARVEAAEAALAAMTASSQRNAELADSFEKQLVAERAKNASAT